MDPARLRKILAARAAKKPPVWVFIDDIPHLVMRADRKTKGNMDKPWKVSSQGGYTIEPWQECYYLGEQENFTILGMIEEDEVGTPLPDKVTNVFVTTSTFKESFVPKEQKHQVRVVEGLPQKPTLNQVIDEVLSVWMSKGKSFTEYEFVSEIQVRLLEKGLPFYRRVEMPYYKEALEAITKEGGEYTTRRVVIYHPVKIYAPNDFRIKT